MSWHEATQIRDLTHEELLRKQGEVAKELFDARLEGGNRTTGTYPQGPVAPATAGAFRTIGRERELDIGPVSQAGLRTANREQIRRGEVMPKLIKTGTVVGDRADKTITVLVERLVEHRLYRRRYKQSSRLAATTTRKTKAGSADRVQIRGMPAQVPDQTLPSPENPVSAPT